LLRQKIFAFYFGNGIESAAWTAATRIPNILQNLLGEGVLSASFIPVYAGLRAQDKTEEATKVANAIFGLLSLLVSILVAVGVLGAPWLVDFIAPGFSAEAKTLTASLVQLIFPGTGLLVMSAWCLGILNSHRKFFLSYAAPVIWNLALIAAVLLSPSDSKATSIRYAGYGFIVGSALQFLIQMPSVLALLRSFHPSLFIGESVKQVLTGFVPTVAARGVVQVSSYVDLMLSSLISERASSVMGYAQTISLLPVSLFGMAISASELPAMSEDAVKSIEERKSALKTRLQSALSRMQFLVIPSAFALVFIGDSLAAILLQGGKFTPDDTRYAWYILAGSGLALWPQTSGRVFSSALYALKDTKSPLRFAILRVCLGIALGYLSVHVFPDLLGIPTHLGAALMTLGSGFASWIERTLLMIKVEQEVGMLPVSFDSKIWISSIVSGVIAIGLKLILSLQLGSIQLTEWNGHVLAPPQHSLMSGLAIAATFTASYAVLCLALRVPQATAILGKILSRFKSV
jgi:putative peptidoglycan lipid II flippase